MTDIYLLKIILVGESCVGKTAFASVYCDNIFDINHFSTVGVDVVTKKIIHNNKNIKMYIWDTAGQERFKSITTSYYKGANAGIIMFDLTNIETLKQVDYWIKQLEKYITNKNFHMIIVGNKSDEQNQISENVINEYLDKYDIEYIKTSAYKGENVNTVFDILINKSIDNLNTLPSPKMKNNNNTCC